MLFLSRAASFACALTMLTLLPAISSPGAAETLATVAVSAIPPSPPTRIFPAVLQPTLETSAPVEPAAPVAAFATLAAAVASQASVDQPGTGDTSSSDRELRCLAAGVYFESKGEPLAGQLAVAQVILARAGSGRFASSACGVLTQAGQFSFVHGGVVPSAEGRPGWDTAVAVARVAQRDLWDTVAPKALFFQVARVAPGARMTRVAAIGNHVFYR